MLGRNYAMFRSYYQDGSVTTDVSHVLWFPDKPITTGDIVVLYSRTGADNSKTNSNGTTSHFFYWNSDKPLWKDSDYSAVLLNVPSWSSFNPLLKG